LEGVVNPTIVHKPEFMIANDPGKPRPLVKNHPTYLSLRPLHKLLYDEISTQPWLLRGPPSEARLKKAGFKPNGKYFSADFTAATDGLPTEVAESIIDELAFLSSPSLSPLLSEARASLRPHIYNWRNLTLQEMGTFSLPWDDSLEAGQTMVCEDGKTYRQFMTGGSFPCEVLVDDFELSTGQLMGNYLSFPLLCMQNYFATTWVDRKVGASPPRLINGDDLLVECGEEWERNYRALVPALGLTLNDKKTSYTRAFMCINSMFFTRNLKHIPVVRCGALATSDPRDLPAAVDAIGREFRGRKGRWKSVTRAALSHFEDMIRRSGQTLYKLGVRVHDRSAIPKSLWAREKKKDGGTIPEDAFEGFHQRMVRLSESAAPGVVEVVKQKEIAEIVVSETWKLGEYQQSKRMKLKRWFKASRKERAFRCPERAVEAARRLMPQRKEEKVVIPESLEACLTLTHERSFVKCECGFDPTVVGPPHDPSCTGTFVIDYVDCELCRRVMEYHEGLRDDEDKKREAAEAEVVKVGLSTVASRAVDVVCEGVQGWIHM